MPSGPEELRVKSSPGEELEPVLQRQRAKRLPAAERKSVILREAALFFAKEGFAASTRDLADRLGVRQALLYKYFPSKEALLESIVEDVLAVHWAMAWAEVLEDQSKTLHERLTYFYGQHLENEDGIALRLFLRAALDGWSLPARRMELIRAKLVRPLVAELRREAKLPGFGSAPLMWGEIELVMTLHASVVFYSMRHHIYGGEMPSDAADVVRFYVMSFLNGAQTSLLSLHAPDAPASLTQSAPVARAVA